MEGWVALQEASSDRFPPMTRRNAAKSALSTIIILVLFFSLIQYATGAVNGSEATRMQTPFFMEVDMFQQCKTQLTLADANMDGQLAPNEFVTFLDLFSQGDIKVIQFQHVPLRIMIIYHWIACTCSTEPGADQDCCVGNRTHVNLTFDNKADGDVYLFIFCSQIEDSIMDVLKSSESPSQSPSSNTRMPSVMVEPTSNPTATNIPSVTVEPTSNPTATSMPSVTVEPTSKPTATSMPSTKIQPTSKPTATSIPSVTVEPTSNPTATSMPSTKIQPTSNPTATVSPTVGPSQSKTRRPSNISLPIVTLAPTRTPSQTKSALPSEVLTSIPSISMSQIPSIGPSLSVSMVPSQVKSSPPSLSPIQTHAPSITLTTYPTVASPPSQPEGLVCVNFQYGLTNDANLTAADIFEGNGNTLKIGLVIATETTVVNILNTSFPVLATKVYYILSSERYETANTRLWSMLNMFRIDRNETAADPGNWVRHLSGLKESVEYAVVDFLGGDLDSYNRVTTEMDVMERRRPPAVRTESGYLTTKQQSAVRRAQPSRRQLVIYTEEIPAVITSIADVPIALCSGTGSTRRCSIVSSTVCVIAGPNDDQVVVRQTLVLGLARAISSGEFLGAVPPEHQPM